MMIILFTTTWMHNSHQGWHGPMLLDLTIWLSNVGSMQHFWSFACNTKRPLQWPHLNVWELKFSDEVFRFRYTPHFQMKCSNEVHTETQTGNMEMSSYFQMKCSDKLSDITPPPPVSDEVQTETQTQNEEKSSYFQMKCPDSDIPPIVVRWSAQMKCTPRPKLEIWKVVHIFRWSVQISCQIYPASFRWSAHWDPNPKWGNEFIFLDGVSRSGVRWSEPDEVHMDIRYEFIFSDEVLR